jgi:hypothetical protein
MGVLVVSDVGCDGDDVVLLRVAEASRREVRTRSLCGMFAGKGCRMVTYVV